MSSEEFWKLTEQDDYRTVYWARQYDGADTHPDRSISGIVYPIDRDLMGIIVCGNDYGIYYERIYDVV